MSANLLNLGGFLGSNGDPNQFNLSAAASALTGGSPLFDPGALGKYLVTQAASASMPYTSGLAKNGPRTWQLVLLDPASGGTFGNLVVWKDYSNYVVTTVSSNTKPNDVAGVLLAGSITTAGSVTSLTHDATNGNYVFILIDGIATVQNEAGTAAVAGAQLLAGVTTAGRFQNGAAVGTAPTTQVLGTELTAKAALHAGITTAGDYLHAYVRIPKALSF